MSTPLLRERCLSARANPVSRLSTVPSSSRSVRRRAIAFLEDSPATTSQATPQAATASTRSRYSVVTLQQQLKEIRKRFCEQHYSGGVVYLEAGNSGLKHRNEAANNFRPESNFAYLAGASIEDSSCLLDAETGEMTLLVPRSSPATWMWTGQPQHIDDTAQLVGADRVVYTSDLDAQLARVVGPKSGGVGRQIHTLPDLKEKLRDRLADNQPDVRVVGSILSNVLRRCRAVKTDAEVGCLIAANCITGAGHIEMWRGCRPGIMEYQLEALFTGHVMFNGARHMGYAPIVGSGRNAAILHYSTNSRQVTEDDLVLVDAGAEFRCYTADITRTFPATGKFSAAQGDLYDLVLSMQCEVLEQMKADDVGIFGSYADSAYWQQRRFSGERSATAAADWAALERTARVVMLEGLQELGVLRRRVSVEELLAAKIDRVFMPHGLGHHLGLDVHDPVGQGGSPVPETLDPGHVVTVEPGVYFINSLLQQACDDSIQGPLIKSSRLERLDYLGGVRIEDNVALDEGHCWNLTAAAGLPKSIPDIEAMMSPGK